MELIKIKNKWYINIKKINGEIKNATISKEATGKYYVSLLFEIDKKIEKVDPQSIVGIDLGVKNY